MVYKKTPLNALAQGVPKRLDKDKVQTILYNAASAQKANRSELIKFGFA